jgi:predicted esterase YcpF (UPF0227 family)
VIIYLHGFSSSAASHKSIVLRHALSPIPLRVPDYPSHQPSAAIAYLSAYIQQQNARRVMLIGSSLGGYYAQYLATNLAIVDRVVLINPALQPQITLRPHIGVNRNMQNTAVFDFSQSDFDQLPLYDVTDARDCAPSLVLLDAADEVIDYQIARRKYAGYARVLVFPGGSHCFEHLPQVVPHISAFYQTNP